MIRTTKNLDERCTALSWARNPLRQSVDPDTSTALLSSPLAAHPQGLYVLPPHTGAQPATSLFHRLAEVHRYGHSGGAPRPPPPQPQPPTSTGGPGGCSSSQSHQAGKLKWMMHDELVAQLPADVYQALDTASLQDSCMRTRPAPTPAPILATLTPPAPAPSLLATPPRGEVEVRAGL